MGAVSDGSSRLVGIVVLQLAWLRNTLVFSIPVQVKIERLQMTIFKSIGVNNHARIFGVYGHDQFRGWIAIVDLGDAVGPLSAL